MTCPSCSKDMNIEANLGKRRVQWRCECGCGVLKTGSLDDYPKYVDPSPFGRSRIESVNLSRFDFLK